MLLYAAKNYKNKAGTTEEFLADFKKIDNIGRSIARYGGGIQINLRLLLNQIVTASNIFGVEPVVEMLICRIDEKYHSILYPLLVYLGYLTDEQLSYKHVLFDMDIVSLLRKL